MNITPAALQKRDPKNGQSADVCSTDWLTQMLPKRRAQIAPFSFNSIQPHHKTLLLPASPRLHSILSALSRLAQTQLSNNGQRGRCVGNVYLSPTKPGALNGMPPKHFNFTIALRTPCRCRRTYPRRGSRRQVCQKSLPNRNIGKVRHGVATTQRTPTSEIASFTSAKVGRRQRRWHHDAQFSRRKIVFPWVTFNEFDSL